MDCYYYLKITTLFAENVVAVVMIMFSYTKKKTITLWLKGVKTMDFPFVIVKPASLTRTVNHPAIVNTWQFFVDLFLSEYTQYKYSLQSMHSKWKLINDKVKFLPKWFS